MTVGKGKLTCSHCVYYNSARWECWRYPSYQIREGTDYCGEYRAQGAKRSGTRDAPVPWDRHLGLANVFVMKLKKAGLNCPSWDKLTQARRDTLARRANQEELSLWEAEAFWKAVESAFLPIDATQFAWRVSLDVLLRVPQRGNPDHYQKAKDGLYRPGGPGEEPEEDVVGDMLKGKGSEEDQVR